MPKHGCRVAAGSECHQEEAAGIAGGVYEGAGEAEKVYLIFVFVILVTFEMAIYI